MRQAAVVAWAAAMGAATLLAIQAGSWWHAGIRGGALVLVVVAVWWHGER